MKKILFILIVLTNTVFASLKVDTSYSTLGAIVKEIGKDKVDVVVLGSSKYDPHFIVPKPSLLSKLRGADLLVINGAGLELGWLPPLIQNAHNRDIKNGAKGFLDISHSINMIDKPTSVSRAFGDVHAQGNPHYSSDPHQVIVIAKAIANKLIELDGENHTYYEKNLANFTKRWTLFLKSYDMDAKVCRGKKVVQYHELYNYFLKRYGVESVGNIEPLPGISPSSKHTLELIFKMKKNNVKTILQDVYHERKTAKFIADKVGAEVKIVPHDLGSVDKSDTLEEFYNTIKDQICQ